MDALAGVAQVQEVKVNALESALRDQKIALYLLDEGEPCAALAEGIHGVLLVIRLAADYTAASGRGQINRKKLQTLRAGLRALGPVLETGLWTKSLAPVVADALDAAKSLNHHIPNRWMAEAWKKLTNNHPIA
jgi:hypothetical protein